MGVERKAEPWKQDVEVETSRCLQKPSARWLLSQKNKNRIDCPSKEPFCQSLSLRICYLSLKLSGGENYFALGCITGGYVIGSW